MRAPQVGRGERSPCRRPRREKKEETSLLSRQQLEGGHYLGEPGERSRRRIQLRADARLRLISRAQHRLLPNLPRSGPPLQRRRTEPLRRPGSFPASQSCSSCWLSGVHHRLFPGPQWGWGDGISWDVSAISLSPRKSLLNSPSSCHCRTGVTATNLDSPLKPDVLFRRPTGRGSRSMSDRGQWDLWASSPLRARPITSGSSSMPSATATG